MKLLLESFLFSVVIFVINNAELTEDHIRKICHEVKVRDDVLVKDFQNLVFEDRDNIFPHMKNYIEAMEEVVECYQKNQAVTARECKDVIDEDGPKFMNLPYDLDVIQSRFNWTEEDTEELYSLRKQALDVWWDLDNLLPPSTHTEMTSRTTWF
uniref:Uncharacterized protein n=1 Tax=Cuerna arida TaxID=1464854 RepID=A0A1B6G6K3_9HEMI